MRYLRWLYQGVILDHCKRPRNRHVLADANRKAEGHGALCGDGVIVYLKIENEVIRDATFEGRGCAIAIASSSLMTEALKNKTITEAAHFLESFHHVVMDSVAASCPELGELEALAGVREFPARVECAMLPWQTLNIALKDDFPPLISMEPIAAKVDNNQ